MKKLILSLSIIAGLSFASFAQDNSKVAESFVNHLIEDNPEALYSLFSDAAKEVVKKEDITELSTQLKAQLGTPKNIHGATEVVETEGDETFDVVYYHVEYEMGDLDYKIVFGEDKKVNGFFIVPHEDRNEVKKN